LSVADFVNERCCSIIEFLDKKDSARDILGFKLLPRESFLKGFSVDVNGKIIPFNENASSTGANDNTLKKLATVQAGIIAKSLPISIMEIFVYKTTNGVREKQPNHFLQYKLNKKPNSYTTRNKWFQTVVYHLEYWGNHYAVVHDKGTELELEMIHPNLVKIKTGRGEVGKPLMTYEIEGFEKPFQSFKIIHVKGFGGGIHGGEKLSERAGDIFKWELALNTFGQAFLDNGAKPANVILQDVSLGKLSVDQLKEIRDDYINHQGKNSGGTKVFQPGWTLSNTAHSNDQNQYIESKTHAVQNGARVLNVPLHKLKELSRGTYNNLAVVEQSFARDSLQPITESIEAEYADKLFTRKEINEGFEIEFDYKKLLKFDPLTQADVHARYISNGVLVQDEARRDLNMNPLPEGLGEKPMVNGGMVFIKDLDKEKDNE